VALRKLWTRGHRPLIIPALGLTAALAAVLTTAACTSAPASSAANARPSVSPAITAAQAARVWSHFVSVSGPEVSQTGDIQATLAVATGPERAIESAQIAMIARSLNVAPADIGPAIKGSAYPLFDPPASYYLPEQSGYPRFFVVDVNRKPVAGGPPASGSATSADGVTYRDYPTYLFLFEQASAGAPWLAASLTTLPVGESLPKLAVDSAGYIPTVPLSDGSLQARPDEVGALQAAVVDDGPASAATKAVAAGPLTTGLYQGAANHTAGLKPPHGDVYQWELQGTSYPQFALRTADGGALVFYTMTLSTTVAVPDYINKADPIRPGPPISVPANLKLLLPQDQPTPLIQLSSDQTLPFAAIDPPQGKSKIQVIAMNGAPTSASAS
jgi:hypothetical protein